MKLLPLSLVLVAAVACSEGPQLEYLTIDHYLTTCDYSEAGGIGPCSKADRIDGFDYVWGTRTELTVRFHPPDDVIPDAPGQYELLSIDGSTPAAPGTEFETVVTTDNYWRATVEVEGNGGTLFPGTRVSQPFECIPVEVCSQIVDQGRTYDFLRLTAQHTPNENLLRVSASEPALE